MRKAFTGLILGLCCWAAASVSQATHYALCTGLNQYNKNYVGSDNWLSGCVPDAKNVYTNITLRGEWTTATAAQFLNSQGTFAAVSNQLMSFASKAVEGDVVLYYHSSHGYQDSGKNTGICMYDQDMPDSSFAKILANFKSGVKVIIVLDTCHSGGMFKSIRRDGTTRDLDTGSPFAFAERVNEELAAIRADEAARGIRTAAKLAILDCGWVTAADYNQYSWDGDEGGAFTECYVGSVKSGACDKSPYGNGDSYATFLEMFNYAVAQDETHGDGNPSSEDYTMPQCTNTTILAAVRFGWVGKEEPSGVRFDPIPEQTATVGEEMSYTLTANNSDGSSGKITFSVASATAPAGSYSLDSSSGAFSFTPATDGTFYFNFVGTNATAKTSGKASMTVTASLAAPAKLSSTGITASSFTANWDAVVGAASYLVDVATDDSFDRGGGGVLVEEGFDDGTKLAEGWAVESGALGGIYDSNGNYGNASPSLKLSSTVTLSTPTLSHPLDISFWYKGNGSSFTSTLAVEQLVGGSWTAVSEAEISGKAATYSHALNPAATQVRFVFTKNSGNVALDDVKITGVAGDSTLVVDGESVSGTAYTAEALDTDTYYWRVRAVGNAQGPYSATEEVTLVANPNAPPSIRAIDDIEIEVGETATAAVKVSAPVENPVTSLSITAGDAAAKLGEDGVFSFAPEAVGVYPFTITAVNAKGSAEASFTVTATLAEPETPEVPTVVGSEGFTAEWEAIPGAESYELVVIEGKGGSSGGGGSGETLTETFAKASFSTAGGSYANQTISGGDLGTWTATQCRGDQGGVPTVGGTGTLTSPEIEGGVSAVEFDYDWPFDEKNATGDIDLYVGGSKVSSASVTGGTAGTAAYSFSPVSGATSIEFVNAYSTAKKLRISFNEIRITTASGKSIARVVGDVVYSNNVGNVTSFEVTGLQPSTEYTFAFRAIAANGETTDWSEPVSVTTSEGPSAPVWSAIPAQNTYAGATFQLDLSAYLSGSPTPTVTADVGTVTGLHYVYEPEATGTVTVTLTAVNDSGIQETTFVLSVAEPPVGGNHYAVVVGCNKYDTEYIDSDHWLNGCVPDANHVQELITSRGEWEAANVTKLTDSAAKHSAVLSAIAAAAEKAVPGDTFLYSHSSHGGNYTYTFVTNTALYTDWPIMVYSVDPDGTDNCVCTYDADFTAAELASALAAFDPAVNIVVMIDACHSAGMFQYDGTPVSQRVVRRNAAGKAMRSADASVFAEAVRAQIGAIRRARGIRAASNVAFVTAANFDEYSYDSQSGDGGEFTTAFVEGVTNGVCDGSEYGDQDGWATFYEGWNYAKDIATGMAEGTVVDYDGHTVDANGYALVDNSDYTGAPYYEPEYYYDYYFTHAQIDNEPLLRVVRVGYAGTPTLAAPVANAAADVTASSFAASWSAVADATGYRLQVATDESFSTGGASDTLRADDLAATGNSYTDFSGVAKNSDAVYAGKTAKTTDGAIQLNNKAETGAGIWTTASGGTASRVAVEWNSATTTSKPRSLEIYGSDTALTSYSAVKAATLVGTITYGTDSALDLDGSYAYVGIVANGGALYLDSVTIDWGTAGSGSTIVLDENLGNVTSFEVTGLEAETDYWYRVQALGDPVDSDFSNVIALTTEAGTPYAPVWSEIPEQSAVAGQMFEFDASGYVKASPAATITLMSSTASDDTYECEGGYLVFTPPAEGSYGFEFQAANDLGVSNATLTVVAAGAPVTVPTLALSNPQAKSFDAAWNACTGVSSYTLQVATDDQFTTGSSAGTVELFSNPAGSATAPEGWTYDISSKSSKYLVLDASEQSVVSPAVSTKGFTSLAVSFKARTYGGVSGESGTALVEYSTDGSAWTEVGSETAANTTLTKKTIDATACIGLDSVKFRWTAPNATGGKGIGIDSLVLSGEGSGGDGSLVKELKIDSTSTTVDGLEPETTYYARVKGAAEWSAVESIKTQADVPTAPEWLTIPTQEATVGQEFVIDLSPYVTGSPFPTITVNGEGTEDGNWSFTPDEAKTYTFELVASNTEGTDSTTLIVVASEAPAAKYALCVGVNDYDYAAWESQGWEITPLHGTVNDATYFRKNLMERGGWAESDITFLTNETATKAAIQAAIAGYAAKAKAGDTFVYQHSSHGLNHGEDAYVKEVGLATYATIYEDFELAEDLAAFASGVKVVIVIDACHSGGMFKGAAKAGSFDIAARVGALIDAKRTARKARGEDVSKSISSEEIGWVTAADFDETSKDAGAYDTGDWIDAGLEGVGMGTVPGGVFLASFTWGGWNGKADVSGTGDGDGWLDAYEGWAFATPVCAEFDHTPQFLHEDVLRSVELGWIGEAAPSEAIVFDPVPGAEVGIGEEATLNVVARNADGTTDGITLRIVEPSPEELAYTFADGTLTFTPAEDGLFLFTVQAVNGRTSATKLLGVTAVLSAPVALDATDVADASFTANWTGVDAAEYYQLQVSTAPSFPMAVPDTVFEEGFDDVTSAVTLPDGWEFEGTFGTYTATTSTGEAPPSIKLSKDGNILTSPAFELTRAGSLGFWTKGMGTGTNMTSTLTVQQLVGEEWQTLEEPFVPSTQGEEQEFDLDKAATRVRFVIGKPDGAIGNIAIDDVMIAQANEVSVVDDGEIPAGTTSYPVEDLKPGTTYYYRVRALANTKSIWSEVIKVTTKGGSEPEEPEIGGEDMEDFELVSAPDPDTDKKSIKAKATGKLAEDYNSVKLEYATELAGRDWNFDKTVVNGATWPEIEFEYPDVDFAIMRFVFE